MDDPWGSPWADEQFPVQPDPLARYQTAEQKSTSQSLNFGTASPWDQDDDSGDWFSGSPDGVSRILSTDSKDPSKAALGQADSRSLSDARRVDTSQNLEPSIQDSKTRLQHTRASPDPWADVGITPLQEISGNTSSAEPSPRILETLTLPSPAIRSSVEYQDNDRRAIDENGERVQDDKEEVKGSMRQTKSPSSPSSPSETTPRNSLRLDEQDVEPASSRPSSSPSDPEEISESPRTSFEEESKSAPDFNEISKVQGLVKLYNRLERENSQEAVVVAKNRSQSSQRTPEEDRDSVEDVENEDKNEDEDEDEDDFGDFEEGDGSNDIGAEADNQEPELPDISQVLGVGRNYSNKPPEKAQFVTDMSFLNKLYPDARDTAEPTTPAFLSNRLEANISSTEEKKLWYRISRYGSMRKHDSGDEDNYRPISWRSSVTREETLKIVGRWKQEERLHGRPGLGGRSSSIFGWAESPTSSIFSSRPASPNMSKDEKQNRRSIPAYPSVASSPRTSEDISRRVSLDSDQQSKSTATDTVEPAPQFSWSTTSPVSDGLRSVSPIAPPPASPERIVSPVLKSKAVSPRIRSSSTLKSSGPRHHSRASSESLSALSWTRPADKYQPPLPSPLRSSMDLSRRPEIIASPSQLSTSFVDEAGWGDPVTVEPELVQPVPKSEKQQLPDPKPVQKEAVQTTQGPVTTSETQHAFNVDGEPGWGSFEDEPVQPVEITEVPQVSIQSAVQDRSSAVSTSPLTLVTSKAQITSRMDDDPGWGDFESLAEVKPAEKIQAPISPPQPSISLNISRPNTFFSALPSSRSNIDDDDAGWGDMASSPAKTSMPTLQNVSSAGAVDQIKAQLDDDDDWGEMVASPVVDAEPVFNVVEQRDQLPAPVMGLQKRSMTFDDILGSKSSTKAVPSKSWDLRSEPQFSVGDAPAPAPAPELRRPKRTVTFDDILSSGRSASEQQTRAKSPLQNYDYDIDEPIASSSIPTVAPAPALSSMTADPWGAVDFSFFDSPVSAPTIQSKIAVPPKPRDLPQGVLRGNQKSKIEAEQDRIVLSVVRNLPDLSYMLRK